MQTWNLSEAIIFPFVRFYLVSANEAQSLPEILLLTSAPEHVGALIPNASVYNYVSNKSSIKH